jgi:hypothetical protein
MSGIQPDPNPNEGGPLSLDPQPFDMDLLAAGGENRLIQVYTTLKPVF